LFGSKDGSAEGVIWRRIHNQQVGGLCCTKTNRSWEHFLL